MAATLVQFLTGIPWLGTVAYVALGLYVGAEWPRLPGNARVLTFVAVILASLVVWHLPASAEVFRRALDQACYFATFVTALNFLREAAETSPLVRRCGQFLVNQPPGKRYITLSTGAYLFGIILNIGVINLLGVMIRRGNTLLAAGGNEVIRQVRERRMSLALLRGFSVTTMASPLSITLALILANQSSLSWQRLLPLGFATALGILGIGWLLDRFSAPYHLAHLVPAVHPQRNWRPILQFIGLVLFVVTSAVVIESVAHIPLIWAVLLIAPFVGFMWLAWQRIRLGPVGAARAAWVRLRRRSVHMFPDLRTEVVVLAAAGFVGSLIVALVPPTVIADFLQTAHITGVGAALAVTATVVLVAQVGINPIISVTLLASALKMPMAFGLAPECLALSLMLGWALSINTSALTASTLMLSRLFGFSPGVLGYQWNGPFTFWVIVAFIPWLFFLQAMFNP